MIAGAETPHEGITSWRNTNGFYVVRLHYTADPAKRDTSWRTNARAGMPERGWRREMEIDFTAPEGEPVFPEFDHGIHVQMCEWIRGSRVVRGWDSGYVSPAIVIGQLSAFGQLRILAEVCPFNTTLESLVPMVNAVTFELSTDIDLKNVFDAGDPAANAQTDLGVVRTILLKHGIALRTARPGTKESYETLRHRLMERVFVPGQGQLPALIIHPRCKTLIASLSGAFHRSLTPPYQPVKAHPYKDVADALRYLSDNLHISEVTFQRELKKATTVDQQW